MAALLGGYKTVVTRFRYAEGAFNSDGEWENPTPAEDPIRCTVQPLSGRDWHILVDYQRKSEVVKMYTKDSLGFRTGRQQSGKHDADRLVVTTGQYQGTYRVIRVSQQPTVIAHHRCYAARLDEATA